MKNADKSAYPVKYLKECDPTAGLTKRELFAMAAMQGFLSSWPDQAGNITPDGIAGYAIACADELLKQLES